MKDSEIYSGTVDMANCSSVSSFHRYPEQLRGEWVLSCLSSGSHDSGLSWFFFQSQHGEIPNGCLPGPTTLQEDLWGSRERGYAYVPLLPCLVHSKSEGCFWHDSVLFPLSHKCWFLPDPLWISSPSIYDLWVASRFNLSLYLVTPKVQPMFLFPPQAFLSDT